MVLTSKIPGPNGNSITYSTSTSTGAQLMASVANDGTLSGGGGAANVGPGTIVTINSDPRYTFGPNTVAADMSQPTLPTELGGVEVYFNGIQSPLYYVSPTQINAQIPWEIPITTTLTTNLNSINGDRRQPAPFLLHEVRQVIQHARR